MKRREFIQMSLTLGAGSFLSSGIINKLSAQVSTGGKKVVMVFLRGGADVISLFPPKNLESLTPYRDPKLILNGTEYLGERLNIPFYLHPELAPLMPLFQSGQIALIPHTASMHKTRSHFVQQDLIESGSHLKVSDKGILGKTSAILGGGKNIVTMGSYIPHSFRGADPALISSVLDIKGLIANTGVRSGLNRSDRFDLLKKTGSCQADDINCKKIKDAQSSYARMEHDVGNVIAPTGDRFLQHMDLAGQIINSRYSPSIITVDMGDWDTHFSSLAKNSRMTTNFKSFAEGLMAFRNRLSSLEWNNTVVMVISEFGRTIRSNKDLGTDHGAGSMMMLLGGRVNASFDNSMAGWDLTRFEDASGEVMASEAGSSAALLRKIDYRLVVAEVLEKQFGIPLAKQQGSIFDAFPGGRYLRVMKT